MTIMTHPDPIWRDRSDFIIVARIPDSDGAYFQHEQLWVRQVSDHRFEVCCIPFAQYDVALGDLVDTDDAYRLKEVVRASGRYVFRVLFPVNDHEFHFAFSGRWRAPGVESSSVTPD